MNKMKTPAGEDLAENLDREMQKFKIKVCLSVISQPRLVLNRNGCPRLIGAATVNEAFLNLAVYEGRPDKREGLVLLRRYVCVLLCIDVWDGPGVSRPTPITLTL